MLSLDIETRDINIAPEKVRKEGRIPAVYYGHTTKSTPISIPKADFEKIWKEAGESAVLKLKGKDGEVEALIHDIARDPLSGEPIHADFYVFEKGHKIEVDIPLVFSGVAPAIKEKGGMLVKVMHEIKVEAMPKDLPHEIEVDISSLIDFDSHIAAKDIKLPAGVTLVEKADEVVVSIAEPKEEEVESGPTDISEVEVEKKGKEKTEEEGSGENAA